MSSSPSHYPDINVPDSNDDTIFNDLLQEIFSHDRPVPISSTTKPATTTTSSVNSNIMPSTTIPPSSSSTNSAVDKSTTEAFLRSLQLNLVMQINTDENAYDSIRLQLSVSGLGNDEGKKQGFFQFSSPSPPSSPSSTSVQYDSYFIIAQVYPDGSRIHVHQSEHIKGTTELRWKPSNLFLPLLCNSNSQQPLIIEYGNIKPQVTMNYLVKHHLLL